MLTSRERSETKSPLSSLPFSSPSPAFLPCRLHLSALPSPRPAFYELPLHFQSNVAAKARRHGKRKERQTFDVARDLLMPLLLSKLISEVLCDFF